MGRALKLGVILLTVLFLAGCWDYQEPDETAWVTALGVDRGRENLLTVTLQIAVAAQVAGGVEGPGGGPGEAMVVVSMEAPSILSAIELTHAWINRRVDLSHARVVVFGRELAEAAFDRYLMPLTRHRDFRPSTKVLVANGRAETLLQQGEPVLETSTALYWTLQTGAWDLTEFIPRDGFGPIVVDAKSPGAAAMPALVGLEREDEGPPDPTRTPKGAHMAGTIPRRGGTKIDVMGAAVISGGRMVGVLNGDETGIVKMTRGDFRRTTKTLEDPLHPGQFIVVEVVPREPPRVDVRIMLEGDITSIQSGEHYERPEKVRLVERAVEESFRSDARVALDKAQNEFGADVFTIGFHAKRLFPTWPAWEAFEWDEKFPDAEISIDFDFRVRRIGLMRETVPFR
ncbi:MAG: Ger(x)C family spore germination protein [Candidatus Desulforudis sp.]|nr:Ger(x)C family spore germination protein [Desulforudis sp.]